MGSLCQGFKGLGGFRALAPRGLGSTFGAMVSWLLVQGGLRFKA